MIKPRRVKEDYGGLQTGLFGAYLCVPFPSGRGGQHTSTTKETKALARSLSLGALCSCVHADGGLSADQKLMQGPSGCAAPWGVLLQRVYVLEEGTQAACLQVHDQQAAGHVPAGTGETR